MCEGVAPTGPKNSGRLSGSLYLPRKYNHLVRVKTSVTLPDDLLLRIDRAEPNRSAFFEKAARKYLYDIDRARRDRGDAAILEKSADRLNEEAADVLEYQALPE